MTMAVSTSAITTMIRGTGKAASSAASLVFAASSGASGGYDGAGDGAFALDSNVGAGIGPV